MVLTVLGVVLMLLGAPFLVRGWLFTLRPDHAATLRARERNLRLGLETDMKAWGRRVRRMGFILCVSGALVAAWGAGYLG